MELEVPVELGPLRVSRLAITVTGLTFPVDLSGGLSRLRHRRGSLETLRVDVTLKDLAQWLTPSVRQLFDWPTCSLSLIPTEEGILVGMHSTNAALAFVVVFAPDEDTITWVVSDARAAGMNLHAHGAALLATQAMLARFASQEGSVFRTEQVASQLAREVLIDAGARLPITRGLRFCQWDVGADCIGVMAERDAPPLAFTTTALRTLEAARLARSGDIALMQGDLDDARKAYMLALEQAPRHPALCLRIAELDCVAGHRPEAAMATIVEAMPAMDGGMVASRLFHALGDRESAVATASRAAELEAYSPLAAMLFAEASSFGASTKASLTMLDEAVARAPSMSPCRWERAKLRLDVGHVTGAVADFAHIEAATSGATERFAVCLQAGHMLLRRREPEEAARFFEHALRYMPSSAEASAGLARAFLVIGDGQRAVTLLRRAVALTQRGKAPSPALLLELARSLADVTNDLPAAIAHARAVPYGIPEAVQARALEGRWRSMLGDLAGASLAYGRARETAEMFLAADLADSADFLIEAARFELDIQYNAHAAKRHLYTALELRPTQETIRSMFRRACALVEDANRTTHTHGQDPCTGASAMDVHPSGLPSETLESSSPSDAQDDTRCAIPHAPQNPTRATGCDVPIEDDAEAEARVCSLTERVRANVNDWDSVLELCSLLEHLDRNLDLFAIVSARLEETTDADRRAALNRFRQMCLVRLALAARQDGRLDEAGLYEDALDSGDI